MSTVTGRGFSVAFTVLPVCGRAASAALMAASMLLGTAVGWVVSAVPVVAVLPQAESAAPAPSARLPAMNNRRFSGDPVMVVSLSPDGGEPDHPSLLR